jgi:signal transduction histidine kinase
MKIRQKLTIQFVLLVSAIALAAFIGIYYIYQSYVSNRFFTRLRSKAITTADLLSENSEIDASLLRKINESNRDLLFKENIVVFDSLNHEVYRSKDSLEFTLTKEMVTRNGVDKEFQEKDFGIIIINYTSSKKQLLIVAAAVDLFGNDTLSNLRQVMLVLYFILVFAVGVTGWFFAGRALQPISDVISQVNDIYPQDFDKRLKVTNEEDEIGILTITFNQLLNRTEEAFKQQRFFISNVSHELKNPLSKIISQIEVVLLKDREIVDYKKTLSSVLEDIQNLSKLSQTLLELSRLTEDNHSFLFSSLRLDELLWETKDFLKKNNPEYSVAVSFENITDVEEEFSVLGNPYLLKIALFNLLENGCKFSSNQATNVKIRLEQNNIIINFTNISQGIGDNESVLIFQPFYRSNNTATIKGYGIGLSLVEKIAKLHGGSIKLVSNKAECTSFSLSLPILKIE